MSDKKEKRSFEKEIKDEAVRKKKQKRELKNAKEDSYLNEMLENVEDDELYQLMKKIK